MQYIRKLITTLTCVFGWFRKEQLPEPRGYLLRGKSTLAWIELHCRTHDMNRRFSHLWPVHLYLWWTAIEEACPDVYGSEFRSGERWKTGIFGTTGGVFVLECGDRVKTYPRLTTDIITMLHARGCLQVIDVMPSKSIVAEVKRYTTRANNA